jgi:GNAT superfamily N-acetyltransferase
MLKAPLPPLEGYSLAYLTPGEEPAVQALLERCADYLELVAGLPPSPELAHDLLTLLPPGKGDEDKMLLGIFAEPGEVVGLLDAVRNYPMQGMWFLGLLLFEPARRGQGLGEKVYRAFEGWAQSLGARSIHLSVAQQNEQAYRFWQRLGFEEMERRPPEVFGAKESIFILMSRTLPPGSTFP